MPDINRTSLRRLRQWQVKGPRMWAELHRWAMKPGLSSPANWLESFGRRIGCGDCRAHWNLWVKSNPVPHHREPDALFAWTVAAHNAVNRRLGKPHMSLQAAIERWKERNMKPSAPIPIHEGPVEYWPDLTDRPGTGVLPTCTVNCTHAQTGPRPTSVTCALNLYGGTPHVSICGECRRRDPKDPALPPVASIPLTGTPEMHIEDPPEAMAPTPGWVARTPAATTRGSHPALNAYITTPSSAIAPAERLVLRSHLSPGDILMLTAAVRDLHRAYPGRFVTAVETSAPAVWQHNPFVAPHDRSMGPWRSIEMHYPLINQSNQRPVHFLQGYCDFLAEQLALPVPVTEFRGDVHLSQEEMSAQSPVRDRFGYSGKYWIIVAGGKYDFTAKWWPPAYYQQVVDHFLGRVQFVQCGEKGHWHPPLRGAFNLVGLTSLRDFIRLMYQAEGVVCPVTLAMHLAAAVPTRERRLRPCVVVAGGREPPHWEAYPGHQFLHTIGCLPCCATGGCWKSRCQTLADGDPKNRENLCERPVQVESNLRVPQCMAMVHPTDVIRAVERALTYAQ